MNAATAACQGDVLRLCLASVPDHESIIACMQQQRTSLSPECRKVFDAGMKSRAKGG